MYVSSKGSNESAQIRSLCLKNATSIKSSCADSDALEKNHMTLMHTVLLYLISLTAYIGAPITGPEHPIIQYKKLE